VETRFDKNGALFRASGISDADVQREIISSYIRAQLVKQVSLYGVSVIFILASCFLIVFSPADREQTSVIIAAALFALAVGIGGFSYFKLKTPLISAEVGSAVSPNFPSCGAELPGCSAHTAGEIDDETK